MKAGALLPLIEDYVKKIKDGHALVLSGHGTPELTYRPKIDDFLQKVAAAYAPDAEIVHEPSSQLQKGRPDWLSHHRQSKGVYGYVEAKDLDPKKTLDWKRHQKQIDRYLSLGHKLMVTDGADFFLFGPRRKEPVHLALVEKPIDVRSVWKPTAPLPRVRHFFSGFFHEPKPRRVTDAALIADLAIRAKYLAEDIESLVKLEPGEGMNKAETDTIDALRSIKETLMAEYDASLSSNERFSKAVSQILVFGAFYAHRHLSKPKKPANLESRLTEFWTSEITTDSENRLKPFRALAAILSKGDRQLGAISSQYAECIRYLSYVKLSRRQREKPNYHKLYEKFLSQFDPKDKVDFGAYATPSDLARFMVGFAEFVSSTVFGKSIFMSGNKIVEPCCGTGTFLEEIVKEAAMRKVKSGGFPTVAGFEILAAPYALSQYRLYQIKDRYPLASHVRSLLCNTLSDRITDAATTPKPSAEQKTLLDDEMREAAKMADPPITLVIGNPPSSDADKRLSSAQSTMSRLIEDFRPPKEARKKRQNTQKQMKNDFVKFLRWACHKVESDKYGIVSFILPSTFLQHPSYEFARKWIYRNFSDVWVVEFDKDARTGVATSNIFATQQGRCMLFCSKTASEVKATVRHMSVADMSASEKVAHLKSALKLIIRSQDSEKIFSRVETTDSYAFKPPAQYDECLYSAFWNLANCGSKNVIFLRHTSGVKLGMTGALAHLDKGQLSRQIREIADESKTHAYLVERWFRGQHKRPSESNLSAEVRGSIRRAASDIPKHIQRYSFRPFINAFAFLHGDTLKMAGRTGGGGARRRPEIMAAFSKTDNPGISVAPSPVDLGAGIQRFASFCWHVPDNDLCTRGNGRVFCATFPEYKPPRDKGDWRGTNLNNISPLLEEALKESGVESKTLGADVVFYVYAVLSSGFFLGKFEGALYSTLSWPKIPVFKGPVFTDLASLGKQIAECEKEIRADPARTCEVLPDDGIRLKKYEIGAPDGTVKIFGHDSQCYALGRFNSPCLEHTISGYAVFDEYLKRNKWAYLRRNFTNEDVLKLYALNDALSRQFGLIRQADRLIKDALEKQELIKPPDQDEP